MTSDAPPTLPRFRLSRGQLALSVVLVALLVTLLTLQALDSSAQRKHTEVYARTETATTNMLYTTRETLAYVDAAQRYVLGVSPRRNAQLARALLGQRLSVVGENGVTAGDALTPEYQEALTALDGASPSCRPVCCRQSSATTRASAYCPRPRRYPTPVVESSTAAPRNCTTPPEPATWRCFEAGCGSWSC